MRHVCRLYVRIMSPLNSPSCGVSVERLETHNEHTGTMTSVATTLYGRDVSSQATSDTHTHTHGERRILM